MIHIWTKEHVALPPNAFSNKNIQLSIISCHLVGGIPFNESLAGLCLSATARRLGVVAAREQWSFSVPARLSIHLGAVYMRDTAWAWCSKDALGDQPPCGGICSDPAENVPPGGILCIPAVILHFLEISARTRPSPWPEAVCPPRSRADGGHPLVISVPFQVSITQLVETWISTRIEATFSRTLGDSAGRYAAGTRLRNFK